MVELLLQGYCVPTWEVMRFYNRQLKKLPENGLCFQLSQAGTILFTETREWMNND